MSETYGVTETTVERASRGRARPSFVDLLQNLGLPLLIVAMCIVFTVVQPRFASLTNLVNVLRQASILAIVASGQLLPVLSGGFDISVASNIALISLLSAMMAQQFGVVGGVVAGIGAGAIIGSVNGLVIARFNVTPFIVTLAMLSVSRGLALILTNGQPIPPRSEEYLFLGTGYVGPVPAPVIIAALAVLGTHLVLRYTLLGRYAYAIGGNEEAAALSGINVWRYKGLVYVFCGMMTGLGATVLTARLGSGHPALGQGFELQSIAAVVIGGAAIGGGVGSARSVVLGVLVIALLGNGMDLMNVSSYYQFLALGIVLVLAVMLDRLRHRRQVV